MFVASAQQKCKIWNTPGKKSLGNEDSKLSLILERTVFVKYLLLQNIKMIFDKSGTKLFSDIKD
jgi:hypothetical protein